MAVQFHFHIVISHICPYNHTQIVDWNKWQAEMNTFSVQSLAGKTRKFIFISIEFRRYNVEIDKSLVHPPFRVVIVGKYRLNSQLNSKKKNWRSIEFLLSVALWNHWSRKRQGQRGAERWVRKREIFFFYKNNQKSHWEIVFNVCGLVHFSLP